MAPTFAGPPVHGVVADAAFAVLLLAVCASDLRTRRVANGLVATIALFGIIYSIGVASWLTGGARALGGLATGFAIWLPFYLFRFVGAGDVKFFAAASAWLGALAAVRAAFAAAIFGAALSLLWILATGGWRSTLMQLTAVFRGVRTAASLSRPLPYAVAMAAGLGLSAWLS